MKTFILKDGAQSILNGVTYKAGDAINTNIQLMKMWPNRFSAAPAGIKGNKWPDDVNDVVGTEKFAVICNRDRSSFKIVDAAGKVVAGCAVMSKDAAFKKYRELMGAKADKVEKSEKQEKGGKKVEKTPEADEEEDSTDEEEDSDKDSEEGDTEDAPEEEDEEEDSTDEEEEEEEEAPKKAVKASKPDKKNKKNKKNR